MRVVISCFYGTCKNRDICPPDRIYYEYLYPNAVAKCIEKPASSIDDLLDLFNLPTRRRHGRRWRWQRQWHGHGRLPQIAIPLQLGDVVEFSDMVHKRVDSAANRVHVTVFVAEHTCVLAICGVALYHKALPKAELTGFNNFLLVSFLRYQKWGPLANLPEVVCRGIDAHAASRASAVTARRKIGGEGLVGHVLEIEAVATIERVGLDDTGGDGRGALWGRQGARRRGFVATEALLLLAQSIEGAFAGRIGGCDQLSHVGAGKLAVVVESVLEDVDDGLLESDDLGLELVLGDGWKQMLTARVSNGRAGEARTVAHGELPA